MGHELSKEQEQAIQKFYKSIDANGNGISMKEFADNFGLDYTECREFFKAADRNADGQLDYNEFKRLVEKRVFGCFRHWAKGGNTISLDAAEEALKDLKLKIDPKAFVAALDKNKDGVISFDEWLQGLFVTLAVRGSDLD